MSLEWNAAVRQLEIENQKETSLAIVFHDWGVREEGRGKGMSADTTVGPKLPIPLIISAECYSCLACEARKKKKYNATEKPA